MHTTVLSTYQPICGGSLPCAIYNPGLKVGPSGSSDQYNWLAGDLASVRSEHATCTAAPTAAPPPQAIAFTPRLSQSFSPRRALSGVNTSCGAVSSAWLKPVRQSP